MFENMFSGEKNQASNAFAGNEGFTEKDPAQLRTLAEVDEAIQKLEEQVALDGTLNPDQMLNTQLDNETVSMKASHEEQLAGLKERREELAQEEDADLLV